MTLIDPELLAIMQCPSCGGQLAETERPPSLTCVSCGLRYPVRDGMPVMLVEEAEKTQTGDQRNEPGE